MFKRCPVCEQKKRLSEFYILKSGKPKSRCKECGKMESRDYRHNNRERCCTRDREYYRKSNKDKLNAARRARYAKDPKAYKEMNGKWDREHPEWRREWRHQNRHISRRYCKVRAKRLRKIGYLSARLVKLIEEENIRTYGVLTCVYCKTPVSNYHLEHKIPISRGGKNKKINLCVACSECNLNKGTLTAEEYRERLKIA